MFNITLEEAKAQFSSLEYKGKKLVADLYGRAVFTYVAEVREDQTIYLSGMLKINKREYDIQDVDCLFEGPPCGFIKGMFLYFIETEVRFKALKALPRVIEREELEELDAEVIVLGELKKKKPKLILLDKFGVTAKVSEGSDEKDLGLTGYKKRHGEWLCPTDKVFESLSLLYAGGWELQDSLGQEIIPFEKIDLDWMSEGEDIILTGAAHFYGFQVDVKRLTSKQRVVPLEAGKVGLLPDHFKMEGLRFKKNELGKLTERFGNGALKQARGPFIPLRDVSPAENFKGILRPYQIDGLSWLWFLFQNGFSGLLADDMGLGKTVQALAFLSLVQGPVLIVCPTTLKFNWLAEIRHFLPSREKDVTLVSYAYLRQNLETYLKTNWEVVFLDEAQAIKNQSTDTFKAAIALKSRFRLAITGTPVENHLMELVNHFKFLMPELELSHEPYELKKLTAPFFLRRKKEQVLKDLPEKIEETLLIDLSDEQQEAYDRFLVQAKEGSLSSRMEILEVILRLRQIACHPLLAGLETRSSSKMEAALADIETLLEEGRKVILFSQFTSMLKLFGRSLTEKGVSYLYLDGETKNRQEVVHTFQNEREPLLFLMSLKAGGVGLNLTRADTILIYDPWWNVAVEDQAIARSHRIGRKDTVFAKRYIARGTVEEKMEELKKGKKNLADQLTSEENWSMQDLKQLLDYS